MAWIPRTKNKKADYLSKIVDPDDWGISVKVFKQLERLWGPYDEDWYASDYNTKVSVFFSRYWNPGAVGMDAFTSDWSGRNGWFVPPVYLIGRVLLNMELCKAFGTVIIPVWMTGRFWPILCPDGKAFIKAVKDARYLPESDNVCVSGRGSNSVFSEKKLPC
ncbi:uncharacterized protein LOC117321407 [Pecten maximus]|uniref:uncharacterized protein LOC117321407 n=1 Tax=Pecten maximus TaxID=6579 RepID=UPI0014589275|nr:uncharacterized protein LOC117321407 [Pecten maximus]